MNYRQKERLIDRIMYNNPYIFFVGTLKSINHLPDDCWKLCKELQYTKEQIYERWKEISKERYERFTRFIYSKKGNTRWKDQGLTRFRYYKNKNRKLHLDKSPILRRYHYNKLFTNKNEEPERILLNHSSELKLSKIHETLKNR